MHVCMGIRGGQRRVLCPLETDRQTVMKCPTSVLGTKLETSGRVTSIFTRLDIFSDPAPLFWISHIAGRSQTHNIVEDNLELLIL